MLAHLRTESRRLWSAPGAPSHPIVRSTNGTLLWVLGLYSPLWTLPPTVRESEAGEAMGAAALTRDLTKIARPRDLDHLACCTKRISYFRNGLTRFVALLWKRHQKYIKILYNDCTSFSVLNY